MWEFERYGERIALLEESGFEATYAELEETVRRIGALVPARSLVFGLCSNTAGSVAGYAAFLKNRIVPLLLKHDLDRELLGRLIGIYRPGYLYMPADAGACPGYAAAVYEGLGYRLYRADETVSHEIYPELALLLTTSGSTGSPRLVRQSYANIESNTRAIIEYLGIGPDERPVTTLPMNYTYGLSVINTHLEAGACICLTDLSILRGEFWDFFERVQATSIAGVPYTYEILKKMRFTKRTLPSLRYMTQAGGKLSPALHEIFAEYAGLRGIRFIVMYGQTEATARMAYLPADRALEKCGSTGIAIPGGRLYLRDTDGSVITEPMRAGELIYEGPNVTLGYAESADDLALGDERGGVLDTGDMAYFDEDGYFFITGRLKRFLKIYGNRVNLDETERIIREAFAAGGMSADLACSGVDDELRVYVASEDEELKKSIRALLIEKTGLSPLAFKVISVSSIPRSDSGKILYSVLGSPDT